MTVTVRVTIVLLVLALLPVGAEAQEARYLRCESLADIEFYAEIRADLPESFVADWVAWNSGCEWITEPVEYDDWWEAEEGVVCFSAPLVYPEGLPAFEGRRCAPEDEWLAVPRTAP